MVSRELLLSKLSAYQGKRTLIKEYQDTKDIISRIESDHKYYGSEYDKIAKFFWAGSVQKTCQRVWEFLKANVRYEVERDAAQSVKSPAAILAQGYGDCKHYATFSNGVLSALNRQGHRIENYYCFANYRAGTKEPQHVFAVVKSRGAEIWIDPVLEAYDYHYQYKNAIEKKADMALYSISGVDGIGRRGHGGGLKKIKRAVLKVGAAPSRNSFLLILKINLFHLASKLKQLYVKGKLGKFLEQWEKAGGNKNVLIKNIVEGSKHYEKKHGQIRGYDGGIGFPPAIAAAIAAATPMIVIAIKAIKGEGLDADEVANGVASAAGGASEAVSGIGDRHVKDALLALHEAHRMGCMAGLALGKASAAKKAKKAARKAKRATKKTTRKAKRATKKAARKAKHAGGDDGSITTAEKIENTAAAIEAGAGAAAAAAAVVRTAVSDNGDTREISMTQGGGGDASGGATLQDDGGGAGGGSASIMGVSPMVLLAGGAAAFFLLKKGRR